MPKMSASYKKVYQGFADDEIRKILAAIDRNTLVGKRNYAMLILAVQTGLRVGDITKLKLSDIDWHKREIHITQSKTDVPICVSLEVESGNAIYDYILNARQKCDIPNIFLCGEYPLRAINPISARATILKYMAIAGIEATPQQRYGFHSFRRAFGTRLLESGTPVHLLSQLLGHINFDSARPYLSASEEGLKECCLSHIFDESEGEAI